MESSDLVSCIITTYNRPDLVGDAIESVLAQTYRNIELFIIDDHSSESYAAVIEKYKDHANLVYVRNEKNLKLSASRNRGIALSKGSYVAFLDDDDTWLPAKLQQQVKVLQDNPAYAACTSCHIESRSKNTIDRGIREFEFETILVENLLGSPSKMMVRKSIVDKIQFSEQAKHAEDWDFYLKLLKLGNVFMIKEPLTIYNTDHIDRMTSGFSSFTIAQIQEKAHITYSNREIIGEKNFKLRMARYYFTGFVRRKNKLSFFFSIVKEVGLANSVKTFTKMAKRVITR
ncbi:MAG: glycosyltransferase involved in cell wall biosynthesis [Paraglaciecola sp.]|jgi:glycosyltransferase involved in cell wall biosynthesis